MSRKDPRQIIRRPVISEKMTQLRTGANTYVFVVDPVANKIEIARAIEEIFDVKVTQVRTQNYAGKTRRMRTSIGRKPDWKKAIVTLEGDQSIEIFDQV
ncbi:MAG: 50S ribosomal protein L23 [Candidatus Eisenbacteria bacterium]|uniref:Large ribosomal subunit protein uL23 n=1 Tax=Eiseniibacteriota bacterium TaxID=2212470 RepID=A0A956NEH4_UNCEI|nr:50S ribosomal protein L23 [Candidatus Eisenbacteria bacterium]MCB9463627.1 50S ribosomal protein L23 [Candidatus Eisenbacteria bacterium]